MPSPHRRCTLRREPFSGSSIFKTVNYSPDQAARLLEALIAAIAAALTVPVCFDLMAGSFEGGDSVVFSFVAPRTAAGLVEEKMKYPGRQCADMIPRKGDRWSEGMIIVFSGYFAARLDAPATIRPSLARRAGQAAAIS